MRISGKMLMKKSHMEKESHYAKREVVQKAEFQLEKKEINRDLILYLAFFNLKLDDLRAKKILDIGSGTANFAKDAKYNGIDVTALDPVYILNAGRKKFFQEKFWRRIKRFITREKKILPAAVAAVGEELPFKEDVFDLITSVYASYHYAEDKESLEENIKESLRVLKPGGQLLIYPILYPEMKNLLVSGNKKHQEELNHGFWDILERLKKENKIKVEAGHSRFPSKRMINPPDDMEHQGYLAIQKL